MSDFSNAPLAQGTTTPVTFAPQGIAISKTWVPQKGYLAAEIAAAYVSVPIMARLK